MFKTFLKHFIQFKFNPSTDIETKFKLSSYVYDDIFHGSDEDREKLYNNVLSDKKHRHIIMYGPKGVGKTTLLKLLYYKHIIDNKSDNILQPGNTLYIKFNLSNIEDTVKMLPKNQLSNFIYYFFTILIKLKNQYNINIFIVISNIKKILKFMRHFPGIEKEFIYYLYYIVFKFYKIQLFTFIFITHNNRIKKTLQSIISKTAEGLFRKNSEQLIYSYINLIDNTYFKLQKFYIYFKYLYCNQRQQNALDDNKCKVDLYSFNENYLQTTRNLQLILYKFIQHSTYTQNSKFLHLLHKIPNFISLIISLSFKFKILNLANPLNCLVLFKTVLDNINENLIPSDLLNIFTKHAYPYMTNYTTVPVDLLLKLRLYKIFKSNISTVKKITKKDTELQTNFYRLKTYIKKYLSGQDHVIDSVLNSLRRYSLGFTHNKPIGVHLFAGFSGTGKTELTKFIASALELNDDFKFLKLEMSEYKNVSDINKLIGSAPGFIGHGEPGKLSVVKTHSKYVILMDEVEKAEQKIYDIFLPIFDEGMLKDTSNNILNFSDTLFILTSNLGCGFETFENYPRLEQDKSFITDEYNIYKKSIYKNANEFFKPEFLARLNSVDIFNPIVGSDIPIVCKNFYNGFVKSLINYLNTPNISVSIDKSVQKRLVEVLTRHLKPYIGVRPLKKIFNIVLEDPILNILELLQLKKIAINNPTNKYTLQLYLDFFRNITFKLGKITNSL